MLRLSDKHLQHTIDKAKWLSTESYNHEHNQKVFWALTELQERRAAEQPAEKKLKLAKGPYDIKPGTIIIYDEYGPMPKESDLEKLTGQKWGRE